MALSVHDLIHDPGCPDLGIPDCQTCPLDRCRFDAGNGSGRARATVTATAVHRLLCEGRTLTDAARDLGISRRTAYRLRNAVMVGGS